jgi:hypothetical protein
MPKHEVVEEIRSNYATILEQLKDAAYRRAQLAKRDAALHAKCWRVISESKSLLSEVDKQLHQEGVGPTRGTKFHV